MLEMFAFFFINLVKAWNVRSNSLCVWRIVAGLTDSSRNEWIVLHSSVKFFPYFHQNG
jgi:hypothetical protein